MSNEKYQLVYFPNHPRSHVNGCVYEHIIVAEKILGRALSQEEVVHHEDENKRNNVDTNLIVFRTNADHIRFHKTGIREKQPDGIYTSPEVVYHYKCKMCGVNFTRRFNNLTYCSSSCSSKSLNITRRPSQEELIRLLTLYTFVEVGSQLGVSDNAVRKWCKSYNISYLSSYYRNLRA